MNNVIAESTKLLDGKFDHTEVQAAFKKGASVWYCAPGSSYCEPIDIPSWNPIYVYKAISNPTVESVVSGSCDERKAFEEWYTERYTKFIPRNSDGDYRDLGTRLAWDSWQQSGARTKDVLTTKRIPENEVHKGLCGAGLDKRQQGRVMGLLRDFDIMYNPRDAHIHKLLKSQEQGKIDPATDAVLAQLQLSKANESLSVYRELINFLLTTDEPFTFLKLWREGQFDVCRKEWPEAPQSVYPCTPS